MSTTRSFVSLLVMVGCSVLAACDQDDGGAVDSGQPDSGPYDAPSSFRWYATCGDPVCGTHRDSGVAACTTEVAGQVCDAPSAECDPINDCNALLRCTDSDPTAGVGGCPISRRAFKEDIAYVDDAARSALADALLRTKLATYRYKGASDRRQHLGFILEDVEPSAAADSAHARVDLYGYTSMAVAALQVQAQKIAELEAHIARLEARLERSRASGALRGRR